MKKVVVVVLAILFSAGLVYAEDQMAELDLRNKVRLGTGLKPDSLTMVIAERCAMDFIQSAALYPVCVDTQMIILAANQEIYAMPSDCYEPITAWIYSTGRVLDWIMVQDKQRIPSETSISAEILSRMFYFQDDSVKYIGFDPIPTVVDTVQLLYEASATEIVFQDSGAQRIRIRECYHPALVAATKAYLWERWGREDKANRYLDKAVYLINVAERKLSTPPIDVILSPKTHTRP